MIANGAAPNGSLDPNEGINVIGIEELKRKLDRGDHFKLVNALGQWEFKAKHIPSSINLHTVGDAAAVLSPDEEIVVYCSNPLCRASAELYKGLYSRGYRRVRRFAGGVAAWEEAGYPLEGDWVHGGAETSLARPDRELFDLAKSVTSASIVDAMGRFHHHRCHVLDLATPTPGRVLFGRAATISYFPTCSAFLDPERYNFAALFYEAVGKDPAGRVLVLASNGYPDASMGGATKLSRAENHGLAGVLADGRLRDFTELARYGFTTYCRGETTRWGGDQITPFQPNVPVVVSGVGILPGQYVYADSGGAVVIPEGEVEKVLSEAANIQADDAGYLEHIKSERLPGS